MIWFATCIRPIKKIPGIPGTDDELMEQARSGLLNNGYPYFDLSFIAENISNEMTGETLDETPNEEALE